MFTRKQSVGGGVGCGRMTVIYKYARSPSKDVLSHREEYNEAYLIKYSILKGV